MWYLPQSYGLYKVSEKTLICSTNTLEVEDNRHFRPIHRIECYDPPPVFRKEYYDYKCLLAEKFE